MIIMVFFNFHVLTIKNPCLISMNVVCISKMDVAFLYQLFLAPLTSSDSASRNVIDSIEGWKLNKLQVKVAKYLPVVRRDKKQVNTVQYYSPASSTVLDKILS
jgi:hypothetical protein